MSEIRVFAHEKDGRVMVRVEKPDPCPDCEGNGRLPLTGADTSTAGEICSTCHGTGKKP